MLAAGLAALALALGFVAVWRAMHTDPDARPGWPASADAAGVRVGTLRA
jgi:hypothetical protein